MSRRSGGVSSRKAIQYPRRSSRERQALYTSLDENFLLETAISSSLFRALISDADKSCESERASFDVHNNKYSRASRDIGDNREGDDFENRPARRRNGHITKRSSEPTLCAEIVSRRSRSPVNEGKPVGVPNMYETVKQRRQAMRQAALEERSPVDTRSRGEMSRRKKETPEKEREGDHREEDDEGDSESSQPRQYLLRTNRHPVTRYGIEDGIERSVRSIRLDFHRRRRNLAHGRRRIRGRDSEGSDSSRSEISIDVEEERRRFGRMRKQSGRFMPMNFFEENEDSLEIAVPKPGASDFDLMNVDRSITFDKVGGLDHHIRSLKEMILFPMLYPDVFAQYNVVPPKGVLFYGPPGTGKTLMARALANACSSGVKKVAFFMRKGTECFSKFFGESERHLRRLFKQAYDMRPAIIFFDEIDGLAPARSAREDHSYTSVVSTLLALMDGLDSRGEVIVIGATNRLDTIDPALRRPGRFDRELRFGLPDVNARLSILKVATALWKSKRPSENDLRLLAEKTAGYCGADLKSLCVEAVIAALRARFPQIYVSDEKLMIDPTQVIVTNKHFFSAMQRIVPAACRDFTTPSRRMDERTAILLESAVDMIIQDRIPVGYHKRIAQEGEGCSELEKVLRELKVPNAVPSVRLLLHARCSDYGQTSYVLPFIVNRLDHLPVFSLSLGSLFAVGNPEDSFSQIVQSALRTASSGTPCILLIPSIDEWQQAVPPSVWHRLMGALDGFAALTPILLLATANCHYTALPPDVCKIFLAERVVEITAPCKAAVESYFRFIIVRGGTRRIEKFIASDYPPIPAAPKLVEEKREPSQLNEEEVDELKRRYRECRLKLIVKYEESIHRLYRDRRFQPFARPVDSRVVPDYYVHITNPMDLSTMYRKVESYKSPQEMLHDFNLIYSNAIEYNSDQDDEGQHIRFLAKLLLDMGKEIVYGLDPKLLKNMEEIKKSLSEVGIDPDATDLENGTPPVCNNTWQKNSYVPHAEDTQNEKITSSRKPPKKRRIFGSSYSRTKRAHLAAKRLRNCEASPSTSPSSVVNGRTDADDSDNESRSSLNEKSLDRMQKQEGEMERQAICPEVGGDVKALESVVDKAVAKTNGWPVVELERIGAELLQTIHLYHSGGCVRSLPTELIAIIAKWSYVP
uniref:Bromo domain-containing protein n=1 Tax=Parascaris univalens TaxID=6257 RepID=A0A915AFS1_PARUN